MGLHGSHTYAVSLEDVRVPAENLLGVEGRGLAQTLQVLDGGRIGIASLSLGLAEAAFDAAHAYATTRHTFGQPLIEHQAVAFMLADMAAEIEASRWLIYRAAWLRDQGRPHTKEASIAKLVATEMAERVARDAIQIHGGYGYSSEYPVERIYRDARLMTIGEGTSEMQRMVIARRPDVIDLRITLIHDRRDQRETCCVISCRNGFLPKPTDHARTQQSRSFPCRHNPSITPSSSSPVRPSRRTCATGAN